MIPQNQAKIFLAKDRCITNLSWLRSCATINDASHDKPSLEPCYSFKDDVLAARKTLKMIAEEDTDLMLLPIAGTIIYNDNCGNSAIIETGKVQYFSVKQHATIEIFNPYQNELVNFLQVWIKPGNLNPFSTSSGFSFEDETKKNKLLKLFADYDESNSGIKFFIGKFDGRKEALHKISKPGHILFVFVIEGAFEVQYLLLETRDALALWNIEEADIEALSNNAVLLIMELPG